MAMCKFSPLKCEVGQNDFEACFKANTFALLKANTVAFCESLMLVATEAFVAAHKDKPEDEITMARFVAWLSNPGEPQLEHTLKKRHTLSHAGDNLMWRYCFCILEFFERYSLFEYCIRHNKGACTVQNASQPLLCN